MRLIDADRLKEVFEANFVHCDDLKQMADAQPTAYDVDGVVEKLKSEAKRWEDSGIEYGERSEISVGRGLRNAIEIVKGGDD